MVKALASALRRLDENAQALLDMLLTAVVIELLRTQCAIDLEVLARQLRCNHALALGMSRGATGALSRRSGTP